MLLQERIEELNSGILELGEKCYLTGFMSPERLNDYYENGIQCYFSKGIYDLENIDFSKIKDNAIFIVLKNNIELNKYQFTLIKKDSVTYKILGKKEQFTKVYKIRKSTFSNQYNYIDSDVSLLFDNLNDLSDYFFQRFKTELNL